LVSNARKLCFRTFVLVFLLSLRPVLSTAVEIATEFQYPLAESWIPTRDFGRPIWYDFVSGGDRLCGYHLAEDVPRDIEDPVYAAAAGVVKLARVAGGYGYAVIIEHKLPEGHPLGPYVTTLYGHLRPEGLVSEGTDAQPREVAKGEIIGYLTSNPEWNFGSIHLHFGIRKGVYPGKTGEKKKEYLTGQWHYQGYTNVQGRCQESDRDVQTLLANWYDPSDFIYQFNRLVLDEWRTSGSIPNKCELRDEWSKLWYDQAFDDYAWSPTTLPNDNNFGCNVCDRFYRHWFEYPSADRTIKLSVKSDDGLWLYVNGKPAGHWGGNCHGEGCVNRPGCFYNASVPPIDITPYLQVGWNLISAHVSEAGGGELFDCTILNEPLATNLSGVCCIGTTCTDLTPSYQAANCIQDGGAVFSGEEYACNGFSPCDDTENKVKGDPLHTFQTSLPLPPLPAEFSFTLVDTLPHAVSYSLPPGLGGQTLTFSDFTGGFTVAASQTSHPDTSRLELTAYDFSAPSVYIFGFPSGVNTVRLNTVDTSVNRGYLINSTGLVRMTISTELENTLFPQPTPVRSRSSIEGSFDRNTGLLTVHSQSYNVLPPVPQRGDLNRDGTLTASDVVLMLNAVFLGNPMPDPFELADLNCDGSLTASDVVLELNSVFLGSPLPCG